MRGKTLQKDIAFHRFGRLTAICKTDKRIDRHVVWKCQCDCGNFCFAPLNSLTTGRKQSCGCLMNETRGVSRITHHKSNEKIYVVWQGMKQRCFKTYHKNYKDYGGRGITVCEEWKNSFEAFYEHVSQLPHYGEEGYSLDRINNNGNYEPGNVKWSTQFEQVHNRRCSKRGEPHD